MTKSKKNTDLELRLDKALKGLKLVESISVDDLKNVIWNETDHMDLARLFQFLTEDETNPKKIEEVMEILQEAWNKFPHKVLQGLSPEEKSQLLKNNHQLQYNFKRAHYGEKYYLSY